MGRSDYDRRHMSGSRARLAELVGGLTLAADLLNRFPPEKVLRTAILAVQLGERAGLAASTQHDAYYLTLLRFLGCSGFAHEEAHLYGAGDDNSLRNVMALADVADPLGTLGAIVRGIGPDAALNERVVAIARLVSGTDAVRRHAHAQCETSLQLAELVGMSEGVRAALAQVCERFDGRGFPAGSRGEELGQASRLFHLADTAEIVHHRAGTEAALAEVQRRAGKHLDPALCAVFAREGAELLRGLASPSQGSIWQLYLDVEPAPQSCVDAAGRERVALAFARFADLKSVYTLEHSPRVAELAVKAAALLGLSAGAQAELRIAGLLHDLGRVSVPNRIWDKPAALDRMEWERVRLHAYHTERLLAHGDVWADAGRIAGATHERLDARGYHRGLPQPALGPAERLLAGADVLVALTSERPHRPALGREQAVRMLREEVGSGKLAQEAVDALIAALDGGPLPRPASLPCGLSEREVEVLRLVAVGKSNAEAGQLLGISPKTVKNHVANVYAKIGVYSRAGAALFASEHGLLR
jgi:HD-GYP domain-containing protein (c-di-GMP phosphodiesterase class II)